MQPSFVVNLDESIETPLTLNNACIRELLISLFFLIVRSRSKSTLGCYIVETAVSIASNDASYESLVLLLSFYR